MSGQAGFAILFKSGDQNGGAPSAQTTNVTFQQNVVKNSPNGINIGATDSTGYPAIPASNFNINNNLLYNIGNASGGTLFQLGGTTTQALSNVAITNNTAILQAKAPTSGAAVSLSGLPTAGFVFNNNVVSNRLTALKGDSQGVGNGSLAYYAPGGSFTGNVVIGGSAGSYSSYPGNYFPGSVSFVNPSAGNYAISGANRFGPAGISS